MCPFADVPLILTLIPFVVRTPQSEMNGGADSLATQASFAIESPTSETVRTLTVASAPEPSVVVA